MSKVESLKPIMVVESIGSGNTGVSDLLQEEIAKVINNRGTVRNLQRRIIGQVFLIKKG